MVKGLLEKPKLYEYDAQKDKLLQQHRLFKILGNCGFNRKANTYTIPYQDVDGLRKSEIAAITAVPGQNEFSEFYQRLKDLFLAFVLTQAELDNMFSGEESLGRYLDLNQVFETYINLKGSKNLRTFKYSIETRRTPNYLKYLELLQQHLQSYLERTQPLFDLERMQENPLSALVEGADEDLFCKACKKLFTKPTVYDGHLTGKKHLKAVEAMKTNKSDTGRSAVLDVQHAATLSELFIKKYSNMLSPQLEETNRTKEEVEEELIVSDDEDDEKIYNPLKLPLRLGREAYSYTCEICGNYVYMGRKAFDRHFQEWRHAHGMRCLGIPNTRHFHEITVIADAYALFEKLKLQAKTESFKADAMEEFEDAEGNVFNKKTFEDLRRQGLL
ncbi:hypothetical protein BC829DRAFT_388976 [Chytridium lagenaria]|nr:hypothetical protein BC829DRAFT_388976 [Chytridium lagenaria]